MRVRVRRDGVREVRFEDEVLTIPHQHEIAAPALSPLAAQEVFWTDPRFLSVSRRDMLFVDAQLLMAIARDLDALRKLLRGDVAKPLHEVAELVRKSALQMTNADAVAEIEQRLDRMMAGLTKVEPSVGPAFEDDVFLAGLSTSSN